MKLDKDLSIVQNWLFANILTINVNKTDKYMIIGSRQNFSQLINEPVLTIGSESIESLWISGRTHHLELRPEEDLKILRRSKHLV